MSVIRARRAALAVAVACALAWSMVAAETGSSAQHLVKQVTSEILEEVAAQRASFQDEPERLFELVDRLVLPYFDLERMSRRVLGKKRWRQATPEQQARFVSALRSLLVRTYSTLLGNYGGQALVYLDPVARKKDDEFVIPVLIDLSGGQASRVAYAMHWDGTRWKVFDVAVDGVSMVTNYRSSFRSEIARHGIDGLIARLEAKGGSRARSQE